MPVGCFWIPDRDCCSSWRLCWAAGCLLTRQLSSSHKCTITLRPRGYKTSVQAQTQNKAQWLAACGHVSANSQSLRFILSLRMNSSFITSRQGPKTLKLMVHVVGGYPAAVEVPVLLCCNILWQLAPLRDLMTFAYGVIFLFAMIENKFLPGMWIIFMPNLNRIC